MQYILVDADIFGLFLEMQILDILPFAQLEWDTHNILHLISLKCFQIS